MSLALGGGVARHVAERADSLREKGFFPLMLEPSKSDSDACILRDPGGQLAHLRYIVPEELSALSDLLLDLEFAHIEIHHFLGHEPELIELIRALGIPYDIYVHDYVWICPRITLMSGESGYCGEPDVSACEVCVEKHGSNLKETISVAGLRARSRGWLVSARSVITPSNDVAKRLARYFPELKPRVVPWEAMVETTAPIMPHETIIRVALIGAINASKGYGVLLECARDAAARNLGIEFLVIGYTENDEPLMQTGKAFVTGKYGEDEVAGLLARERPHFALFPSMWPETWCFALTHALRANVPIIAFDIGAVAERLRAAGTGTLVSAATPPGKLNDLILSMVAKDWQNKTLDARPLAKAVVGSRKLRNNALTSALVEVGDQGQNSMIRNEGDLSTPSAADELTATVKPIILQSGLYAFLISNASPEAGKDAATLLTPAIQVIAGPGVPADAVEFMPALPARGNWLYQSGDALIANVKSKSATVLVTSIRSPGSQPLAIKIERIGESAGSPLPATARTRQASGSKVAAEPLPHSDVRLEILAHIQNRGDLRFVDAPWAGRVGPGLAIEAFSITALEPLSSSDIEYKGLTATGFETPWVSNNGLCGTKGKSTPLIGFAFRLGPEAAEKFDGEYFGYFRSGKTVGPLRNGKPCRSPSSNDPLEGISIRLIAKDEADAGGEPESESTFQQDGVPPLEFGKFRDILEAGEDQAPPTQSARKSPSSKLKRTRS